MFKDYKQLKSGSDIRGAAIGNPIDLTDEAVYDIACAFVLWLKEKNILKIAVGHDSRLSAGRIKKVVVTALQNSGVQVYDCGLCSTPSMFMMTKHTETDCDGAVMITASHHSYDKNGLKFFTKKGGLESSDISELLKIASAVSSRNGSTTDSKKDVITGDFLGLYCATLVSKVRTVTNCSTPLEGLKIVLDAGNGAGGFFADRVLKPLGADTSDSQFLDPDGNFPNHVPNPEDKEAMRSLSQRVVETKADFGIIFDTDVDRAAIADGYGNEVNRNKLIALISAVLLEESSTLKPVIVTDSVTSAGLKEFIEAKGGTHHRFKRGYKNVINEAIRLNAIGQNAPLAIETSGHAAFRENYFLDDGAYLVMRILIKMAELRKKGQVFTDLIKDLKEPKEEAEIRLKFMCDDWKSVGETIIKKLTDYSQKNLILAPDNHEGIRATVPETKAWFLVRMSVHDPIMVINIESDIMGGAKKTISLLQNIFKEFVSKINLENLC